MRNTLLCIGCVIALLVSLIGCSTTVQPMATPTEGESLSVVSEEQASSVDTPSKDWQPTPESQPEPSVPEASTPSSSAPSIEHQHTPSAKVIAFEQPARETDTFYFRANAENGCFAVACTTYQEFLDFLDSEKISFNLDGAGNQIREPYLSQFPPTYFAQGNSLLIYYYYANNLATRSCVKEVAFDQGTLAVTIETKAPASDAAISCDYTPKGYMCKLLNHSEPIDQICVTVNRLKGDQFIKTETNTHQN